MGGFDLTDISGNANGQQSNNFSQPVEVRPAPVVAQPQPAPVAPNDIDATLNKPIVSETKQALAEEQGINTNEMWNPLSEARPGGQFKAGEVDATQEKILAKTEWDTSPTKDHVFKNRRVR